jgi:excisionase family DNA binding protein
MAKPEAYKFLTTDQAADYLRLSRRTLERMRVVGGGPVYRKHGRHVLYHVDDLEAWSRARALRSTAEKNRQPELPFDEPAR